MAASFAYASTTLAVEQRDGKPEYRWGQRQFSQSFGVHLAY
jgi:hypothetical protein